MEDAASCAPRFRILHLCTTRELVGRLLRDVRKKNKKFTTSATTSDGEASGKIRSATGG